MSWFLTFNLLQIHTVLIFPRWHSPYCRFWRICSWTPWTRSQRREMFSRFYQEFWVETVVFMNSVLLSQNWGFSWRFPISERSPHGTANSDQPLFVPFISLWRLLPWIYNFLRILMEIWIGIRSISVCFLGSIMSNISWIEPWSWWNNLPRT